MSEAPYTHKDVMAVVPGSDDKKRWTKIGAVFPVRDGMERLKLDLLPASMTKVDLLICVPRPREQRGEQSDE